MKAAFAILPLTIAALAVTTAPALAQSRAASKDFQNPCASLIKECFAYGGVERSNCFYASGNHSFCKSSDLGKLALKRWSMSVERSPGLDSAPAFLGPNVVDGDCVSNFDAQWSSALVKGDISISTSKSLTRNLDTCTRALGDNLMRP